MPHSPIYVHHEAGSAYGATFPTSLTALLLQTKFKTYPKQHRRPQQPTLAQTVTLSLPQLRQILGPVMRATKVGFSVSDVAKQLGVGRVTLSRVLHGHAAISPEMALSLEA